MLYPRMLVKLLPTTKKPDKCYTKKGYAPWTYTLCV